MDELVGLLRFLLRRRQEAWSGSGVAVNLSSLALLCLVMLLFEAARGGTPRRFFSKNARTDALYVVFYMGGVFGAFVSGPVQRLLKAVLDVWVPGLNIRVLEGLSFPAQLILLAILMDGIGYWVHRFFHTNRYLWAFHSIHHSQQVFTPLTNFRAHFVDVGLQSLVVFVIGLVLGTPKEILVPVSLFFIWVALLAHSGFGWTYGPLEKLIVSPRHHRIHHSVEPRHHHRNFGMTFSLWDHLFGTAEMQQARPAAYGIAGAQVPESFTRQLAYPFLSLARGHPSAGPPEARA